MKKTNLHGSIIITYRCNAKCNMCDCFRNPSRPEEEIDLETLEKLPDMSFTNITGGEPFIRQDIADIVRLLYKKTKRIVVSTNGYFTDRIIKLCEEFPEIGIRISIEGLEETNNAIRGIPDGFNIGYKTLKKLVEMGHKDIGFGMTVQDINCKDLIPLYDLSDELKMEFATATLHNSFYFRKTDNKIVNKQMVAEEFEKLINILLQSKSPKKWARAYFNHGLIHYLYGQKRLLPCEMGTNGFFLDPYGNVLPCNGSNESWSMGNLNEQTWDEIWCSEQAKKVRNQVRDCQKNCWMIGSVSPAMKKRIWVPAWWIIKHKLFMGNKYYLEENKFI